MGNISTSCTAVTRGRGNYRRPLAYVEKVDQELKNKLFSPGRIILLVLISIGIGLWASQCDDPSTVPTPPNGVSTWEGKWAR